METKNKKTNDELVLDLFNTLKAKQKEIATASKPRWETSCTIGYNPDVVTDRMNIQTVTDVNKLVELYAFLLMKYEYFNEAASRFNVSVNFKWMGYTLESWGNDIESRIAQIGVSTKRKELEALESRLNALITVDQRRVMELEAITKELAAQ